MYSLTELHNTLHTFALPFGSFSQPDIMLVRGDVVVVVVFYCVRAYCSNHLKRKSLLTDDGRRRVFQQQRRIETIVVDEELLMIGVSVSEENEKVLNSGVSAS